MTLTGKSIIGSRQGTGGHGEAKGVDPATGAELDPLYLFEGEDGVNQAADLAAEAFESFSKTSGAQRAGLLRAIADGMESEVEEIVARMGLESALPEGRCRGEHARTCGQLRMFANLVEEGSWLDARIEHADPNRAPIPKPDTRSMLRPIGPVAVFGASNFPLAFSVAGGDTASALASGCPVIVKAHSAHPGTSEWVGSIIRDAVAASGMHEGVFSLLYGRGASLGQALVKHPGIRAVGFTGSRGGGRSLMDLAAARPEPIPVYAEMSSINPVFILPGAMAERGAALAEGFVGSLTLGVGQFCTNPGLAFLATDDAEGFATSVAGLVASAPPAVMLTAGICKSYSQGVDSFEAQDGVSVLGRAESAAGSGEAAAVVFGTSTETFLKSPALNDEIFGPASLVVSCSNADDFMRGAASLEGQLTATIHGTAEDFEANHALIALLETKVGRLVFNGFPTGVEVGHAMVHGGPYPASSDGRSTSVGTQAITRFTRPVCWQGCPEALLPAELQEGNPLTIARMVDGQRMV